MLTRAIPFELPIHRFLYISRLAATTPPSAVGPILRQSRERNQADGVGGALVFDGERFGQLLEGPPQVVGALAARIERDPRHRSFHVLHDAAGTAPRLMPQMQTGYAEPELFNALDSAAAINPAHALAKFMLILTHCDLSF